MLNFNIPGQRVPSAKQGGLSFRRWHILKTGPGIIKLFSLSMKFQLLIKTKIPTNEDVSCFQSLRCCIYHANKNL